MSRRDTVDGDRPHPAATTRSRPLKSLWKRVRGPLAQSHFAKQVIAGTIARYIRFVHLTSPPVAGSHHVDDVQNCHPFILTLWHGQHLMAPTIKPQAFPMTAMVSRSDDAELNAMVLERFDVRIVRGSGGRGSDHRIDKGGARALIQLKRQLDAGSDVCMIADISKAASRQAGLGIVTLARISGRPIIPAAIATSRRKVLTRTWDRMVVNLPFGRRVLIAGEPIYVPADADDEMLEAKRRQVTDALNDVTRRADALLEGRA